MSLKRNVETSLLIQINFKKIKKYRKFFLKFERNSIKNSDEILKKFCRNYKNFEERFGKL